MASASTPVRIFSITERLLSAISGGTSGFSISVTVPVIPVEDLKETRQRPTSFLLYYHVPCIAVSYNEQQKLLYNILSFLLSLTGSLTCLSSLSRTHSHEYTRTHTLFLTVPLSPPLSFSPSHSLSPSHAFYLSLSEEPSVGY